MITDDERREAAARLRKMTPEWMGLGGWRFYLKPRLGISAIIQVTEGDPRNVSNALADLIEPEPERTCHMLSDKAASNAMCGPALRCDACGAAVPAAGAPRYCPHCGAKVLSVVEVGCFEDVKVVGE